MSLMRFRKAMKGDSGITLAELLVGFFISILLLTMIGGFFASVARGTQNTAVVDANTRQMSTAMSTMVQYFHAATTYPVATSVTPQPAIVSATATSVKFYAYVNLLSTAAQPVEVSYYVDSTSHNLMEQQWSSTCNATTGYCTFSSTVTATYNLGGPVVTSPSAVFTYYDSTGTVTTTLSSIVYVGINLEWGSTTAGTPGDAFLATRVGLLNLGQSGAQS
jgi:hypothetical protein